MPLLFELPLAHESTATTGSQAVAPCNPTLDNRALSIVGVAQRATGDLRYAAMQIVWRIIGEYYSGLKDAVSGVSYRPRISGLQVSPDRAANGTIYGMIYVGDTFVRTTTEATFARRVIQVGHELQHIQHYRRGITNQDEREFLGFCWSGLAQEPPGTGCMPHAMRRDLIDCALGYLNCLSPQDQAKYPIERSRLLSRRATVNGTRGNAPTQPPSGCRRCNP